MVRIAWAGVLFLVVVGLVVLGRAMPPGPRSVAWLAGSGTVPDDEAAIVRRYLGRHRRHRVVGSVFGVLVAGVAEWQVHGEASLPILVLGGITGVLVGALSAESFRLAGRGGTTSVASLEPRDPAPLPRVVKGARLVLGGSALGALAIAVWGHDTLALWFVAAGALVTALAEATRARIVARRRPVLSFRAQELDARIRGFAGRSVAWLQLATALLVAAGVVAIAPSSVGPVDALRNLALLAAFVGAVIGLHRASPWPPLSWRRLT